MSAVEYNLLSDKPVPARHIAENDKRDDAKGGETPAHNGGAKAVWHDIDPGYS